MEQPLFTQTHKKEQKYFYFIFVEIVYTFHHFQMLIEQSKLDLIHRSHGCDL